MIAVIIVIIIIIIPTSGNPLCAKSKAQLSVVNQKLAFSSRVFVTNGCRL